MKRRLLAFVLAALLMPLFPATALADEAVTIEASPQRVQAGETVAVSGTAARNELLSIKVTDNEGSIVYFNAVRAGSDGTYHDSFTAPDASPRTLTVVAGSGSTVAVTQVTLFIQQYCTVTFNKNGGDTEADPHTLTVKEGEAVASLPAPPEKEGHTFSGWFLEKECETAWDSGGPVITDIKVFAAWTAKTYTVKFFEPDGKTQIGLTQTISWGEAAKIEAAPTRGGHSFDRWVLTGDDDTVETILTSVKENITAVASYTKINTKETETPNPSITTAPPRPTISTSVTVTPPPSASTTATAATPPTASTSATAATPPTASTSATATTPPMASAAATAATPPTASTSATVTTLPAVSTVVTVALWIVGILGVLLIVGIVLFVTIRRKKKQ